MFPKNISNKKNFSIKKGPPNTTLYKTHPVSSNQETPQKPTLSQEDELSFYKNWANFTDIMQVQPGQNCQNWADNLLKHLIPFVKGFQATLYMKTCPETLELIGSYAINFNEVAPQIKIGQNTVGLVAKTMQMNHIVNPTLKDNFTGVSATQPIPIQSILTFPITHQNNIQGVLEILFYQPIKAQRLEFLQRIASNMGTNLCLLANAQIQEKNDALNKQLDDSEEFRKLHTHLTESINYASNIQSAILPNASSFEKVFSDHFLIYQPKDIVSGDFYWLTQVIHREAHQAKAKKIIFAAVVDCTGHGVPGAFMSIIGNTLLNEIVNRKGLTDPAQILKMMHVGVRSRLKQSQGQNKDGMDICLCKIEACASDKTKVTYTGAKRPLYYLQDGLLHKLDGDRRRVGGENQNQPFTSQSIVLSPGDKLFLSTDGFKDIASPQRKSLGLRKFESLLQKGTQFSMLQHREFMQAQIKEYQQGTPQRDDVTLLGIQI
ncbi:GAF domain-containing SpoIIE family protein phosphatase [Microscilla marina]|uniref:Serine/threonine protein kinases n=1 Tax=Microscilla marina ATCC 23134 TaxID=313606 RepID=A1ZEF3_MICM2|nr:SpoIIE family protein phosphatase [Microscilla marina]EAY31461.1 serine/threonine protein kinases [Microscilla marina ATCC 23134]